MGALDVAYQSVKDLKKIADDLKNEPMMEKARELQNQFFDFREELADLQEKNRKLNQKISELEKQQDIEEDLELEFPGYYKRKSMFPEHKFCGACWGAHKTLIPLSPLNNETYFCPSCKIRYFVSKFQMKG